MMNGSIKKYQIAFIISALLMLASCDIFFSRGVADMIKNPTSSSAGLSDLFGSPPAVSLTAPASVNCTDGELPDCIKIGWTSVDNADLYEIERSLDNGASFEQLATVYSNSYSDMNVPASDEAVYKVRAYNRKADTYGAWSANSNGGYILGSPANFFATKGRVAGAINLSWDAVKGSGGYYLFRNTYDVCPNEPYKTLSAIDTVCSLPVAQENAGKKYYFWLKAKNRRSGAAEKTSTLSSCAMGFSLVPGAPPYPTELHAAAGTETDGIWVSWENTGADYYNVYRWSSINSEQIKLTPDGITDIKLHDKDGDALKNGIRYFYAVQAVSVDGEGAAKKVFESGFSDPVEGYLLSPPLTIAAERSGADTIIKWKAVPGLQSADEIAAHSDWGYRLEASANKDGPFSEEGGLLPPAAGGGDSGYTHRGAPAKVFYRLLTDNGNLKSSPSEVFEAVPGEVTGVTAGKNAVPSSTAAANSKGVFPVVVSWQSTSGAVSYSVERATKADGKFMELGKVTATSFTDSSSERTPGKIYCYRVSACNSLGAGGKTSSIVDGYGALTDVVFLTTYHASSVLTAKGKLPIGDLTETTKNGDKSGTVYYKAQMSPAGATIKFTNYCDAVNGRGENYFTLNGNMDTNISDVFGRNGMMSGTVTASGMYPGKVFYDKIQIKGGRDGGGTYGVLQNGRNRTEHSWELLK